MAMMSDEHGQPDRAAGAQGADDLTDGVSPNGSQGGYSALADWAATDSDAASANAQAATGFTATTESAAGDSSRATRKYVARHRMHGAYSSGVLDSQSGQGHEIWPPDSTGPAAAPSGNMGSADAGGGDSDGADIGSGDTGTDDAGSGDTGGGDTGGDTDQAPAKRRWRMSGWIELPILVVVALTIALVIKTFVVQPFFIPSSSMEDTLMIGDKVLVNKLVYHFRSIEPGDVIVFNGDGSWNPNPPASQPSSNPFARAYDVTLGSLFSSIKGLLGTPLDQTDYIKRVIGVPGDRVRCCNAQGLVTVNGVPLHEQSYLYPGADPSQIRFNIVVPPGRLWVMGDNRAVSDDSRLRESDPGGGTIPENKVIGRAFVVIWPPSHWKILSIPSTFNQPGINKSGTAASGSAATGPEAPAAAVNQLLGAQVRPERSYLPLAAGLAGAIPLTWMERRARRRLADRLRRRRRHRHS